MFDPLFIAGLYFALQMILGLPIGLVLISTVAVYSIFAGLDASLLAERVIFASV